MGYGRLFYELLVQLFASAVLKLAFLMGTSGNTVAYLRKSDSPAALLSEITGR